MKLVQYKGGGYDGCIWEWNFFLLDNGRFIDIYSSGYKGVSDQEGADRLMAEADDTSSTYVYDLKSEESLLEFTKENNPTNVGRVCQVVNGMLNNDVMFYECTYCGERVYPHKSDPILFDEDNYHGDGGIGIVFEAVLCENCYCNRCERCEAIIGPDDTARLSADEETYICQYCAEDEEREREAAEG